MEFKYRGLEATLERVVVTEEQIDKQLSVLQQAKPRIRVVTERKARFGDELLLDYAGFCNGVQFEGGTAEKQTLTLGSGTFIPGFEEQLVGAATGEDVKVMIVFPEDCHAQELAGKFTEFHCHVHEIRQKQQYELDDTFAREVFDCENYTELRKKVGSELQEFYDARSEQELCDTLLNKASETLDEMPSEQDVAAVVEQQIENLKAQLSQRNLTLEAYCEFIGRTEQQLRDDTRIDAEAEFRKTKTIEKIAMLEGVTISEEEISKQLDLICEQNHMTLEQLQPYLDEEFQLAIGRSIITGKVFAILRENAKITEIESSPKEA